MQMTAEKAMALYEEQLGDYIDLCLRTFVLTDSRTATLILLEFDEASPVSPFLHVEKSEQFKDDWRRALEQELPRRGFPKVRAIGGGSAGDWLGMRYEISFETEVSSKDSGPRSKKSKS